MSAWPIRADLLDRVDRLITRKCINKLPIQLTPSVHQKHQIPLLMDRMFCSAITISFRLHLRKAQTSKRIVTDRRQRLLYGSFFYANLT